MSKWKPAIITRIEDRSPTVKSFWLTLPDRERLEFRPGQFLTLDLPISERRRQRWRSYSIASAPNGTNEAELCIVRLPEGRGTRYLFEDAEINTEILTKEPGGVFTLPDGPLDHDVVMVCTGTGIAPFRSMLRDRLPKENRRFHLIFGCRRPEDILYREEMEALQKQYSNFTYTVTLSREMPKTSTDFETAKGYVHQIYERDYAEVTPNIRFYLCGWSEMIDEARERLGGLGYGEGEVVYELYG